MSDDDDSPPRSYAEVLPAAHYGPNQLGLFATIDIKARSDIAIEQPILSFQSAETPTAITESHTEFFDSLSALAPQDLICLKNLSFRANDLQVSTEVDHFRALARPAAETTEAFERLALKTFFSYSIPFGREDDAEVHRLFDELCFLNHSCRPNAILCWDDSTGEMRLHATEDIEAGNEICVSYLTNPFQTKDDRKRELGFNCLCGVCSSTNARVEPLYSALSMSWKFLADTHSRLLREPLPNEPQDAAWHHLCVIAKQAGPESGTWKGLHKFIELTSQEKFVHITLARVYELQSAFHLAWLLTHQSDAGRDRFFDAAMIAKANEIRMVYFSVGFMGEGGLRPVEQLWGMTAGLSAENRSQAFQSALNRVGLGWIDEGGRRSIAVKL